MRPVVVFELLVFKVIDAFFLFLFPEHTMAETLTVALRVAEEAIDEAISKAEFENTSQVQFRHTIPSSTLISLHLQQTK